MIAYKFEIVCDLTIFPMDNVSESAGFESCLGICNQLLKDQLFYSDGNNINNNKVIHNFDN